MCFSFNVCAIFLTLLFKQVYCSDGLLEFFISGPYGCFCLPESQCETLVELVLTLYPYHVHQEHFGQCRRRTRPQLGEQEYMTFHYTDVASTIVSLVGIPPKCKTFAIPP